MAEVRKSATGRRPWRCLVKLADGSRCTAHGVEADEKATTKAFYRHYVKLHIPREGTSGGS